MTILAAYGLDNYDSFTEMMTLEPEWTKMVSGGSPALFITGGRFGGGRFGFIPASSVSNTPIGAFLQFATAQPKTIFFGVSMKQGPIIEGGTSRFLLFTNTTGGEHLRLARNPSTNLIDIYILGSVVGNFAIIISAWHRLEIKLTVDDAVGEVTIRLDENEVFTSTGIDTQAGANAWTDKIIFQTETINTVTETFTVEFDDITINDDQGGVNDTWLGDLKIETLRPDADGDVNEFTRSAGTTNFENVDESPGPNDDTDYVESSTVNHQDLYTTTDLSGDPDTIHATIVRATARKDDAGARSINLLVKTSITDVGATQTLVTTYVNFQEIHEVDPGTSVAWTVSGVNATQIGQKNV